MTNATTAITRASMATMRRRDRLGTLGGGNLKGVVWIESWF